MGLAAGPVQCPGLAALARMSHTEISLRHPSTPNFSAGGAAAVGACRLSRLSTRSESGSAAVGLAPPDRTRSGVSSPRRRQARIAARRQIAQFHPPQQSRCAVPFILNGTQVRVDWSWRALKLSASLGIVCCSSLWPRLAAWFSTAGVAPDSGTDGHPREDYGLLPERARHRLGCGP